MRFLRDWESIKVETIGLSMSREEETWTMGKIVDKNCRAGREYEMMRNEPEAKLFLINSIALEIAVCSV